MIAYYYIFKMIRRILTSFGFGTQSNIDKLIHFRKDAYKAIHLTPKEEIKNEPFEEYVGELLK